MSFFKMIVMVLFERETRGKAMEIFMKVNNWAEMRFLKRVFAVCSFWKCI